MRGRRSAVTALTRLPRNEWHTLWNAGDTDARILAIISPSGFERYCEELITCSQRGCLIPPSSSELRRAVDLASIPTLTAEHGLDQWQAHRPADPPLSAVSQWRLVPLSS